MNNTMEYKNDVGSVEFSEADGCFFGKVLGVRALISYEGKNTQELETDFHRAVNDYLSLQGKISEMAFDPFAHSVQWSTISCLLIGESLL